MIYNRFGTLSLQIHLLFYLLQSNKPNKKGHYKTYYVHSRIIILSRQTLIVKICSTFMNSYSDLGTFNTFSFMSTCWGLQPFNYILLWYKRKGGRGLDPYGKKFGLILAITSLSYTSFCFQTPWFYDMVYSYNDIYYFISFIQSYYTHI